MTEGIPYDEWEGLIILGLVSILFIMVLVLSRLKKLEVGREFAVSMAKGAGQLLIIAILLLLLTTVTAGSDTGAYYAGRAFGKRKLCPSISPGKTLNGAIGGVLAAIIATVLLSCFLLPEVNNLRLALAVGLLAID